jgi:hypothetical protein
MQYPDLTERRLLHMQQHECQQIWFHEQVELGYDGGANLRGNVGRRDSHPTR